MLTDSVSPTPECSLVFTSFLLSPWLRAPLRKFGTQHDHRSFMSEVSVRSELETLRFCFQVYGSWWICSRAYDCNPGRCRRNKLKTWNVVDIMQTWCFDGYTYSSENFNMSWKDLIDEESMECRMNREYFDNTFRLRSLKEREEMLDSWIETNQEECKDYSAQISQSRWMSSKI
ncbi:MAG: hypothetical protein Ta2E_08880 [Mycoplasmoidaceae bacterium]|nr:MAG: hypothetical protein Ta2E_08880 [Mycoplasmoidaceae bacterium]